MSSKYNKFLRTYDVTTLYKLSITVICFKTCVEIYSFYCDHASVILQRVTS